MSDTFDVRFIDAMVPHHEMAIEMASVAAKRAEHAEIKDFAARIMTSQQPEIARMKGWRQAWAGKDSEQPTEHEGGKSGGEMGQSMTSGAMDMDGEIKGLRKADPFDKAFLEAMIPHHESAIKMAEPAVDKAEHDELRDLARAMVEAQTRDIDRMKGWLRDWY